MYLAQTQILERMFLQPSLGSLSQLPHTSTLPLTFLYFLSFPGCSFSIGSLRIPLFSMYRTRSADISLNSF